MKMSTMKDSERLDLLKEIGGTKVYEERRRESLKIMQENEVRKNQIQEVVCRADNLPPHFLCLLRPLFLPVSSSADSAVTSGCA